MSNLTGLADAFFIEEARKLIEKHSLGSVTDKEYYEQVWEVASGNLMKPVGWVEVRNPTSSKLKLLGFTIVQPNLRAEKIYLQCVFTVLF